MHAQYRIAESMVFLDHPQEPFDLAAGTAVRLSICLMLALPLRSASRWVPPATLLDTGSASSLIDNPLAGLLSCSADLHMLCQLETSVSSLAWLTLCWCGLCFICCIAWSQAICVFFVRHADACMHHVQEKVRKAESLRSEKERKAAEAVQKQADAKRLAGERAQERERKRKLSQSSQVWIHAWTLHNAPHAACRHP